MHVAVLGEFEAKNAAWNKRYQCFFDDFFECYKSEPISLKIGSRFKFLVTYANVKGIKKCHNEYLTSERYCCQEDIHGIQNNVFDPSKIKRSLDNYNLQGPVKLSTRASLTTGHESAYSSEYHKTFIMPKNLIRSNGGMLHP